MKKEKIKTTVELKEKPWTKKQVQDLYYKNIKPSSPPPSKKEV